MKLLVRSHLDCRARQAHSSTGPNPDVGLGSLRHEGQSPPPGCSRSTRSSRSVKQAGLLLLPTSGARLRTGHGRNFLRDYWRARTVPQTTSLNSFLICAGGFAGPFLGKKLRELGQLPARRQGNRIQENLGWRSCARPTGPIRGPSQGYVPGTYVAPL